MVAHTDSTVQRLDTTLESPYVSNVDEFLK